jgi:hypothetical protein
MPVTGSVRRMFAVSQRADLGKLLPSRNRQLRRTEELSVTTTQER